MTEAATAANPPAMPPPPRDPRLLAAADALARNQLDRAEPALQAWLRLHPDDPYALRMLAELYGRLRRYGEAERLLERALAAAPGFDAARFNYALVLHRQAKATPALAELDRLLAGSPGHPGYLNLKAAVLARLGDYAPALAIYEDVLARFPRNPGAWMSYGHALKTIGRRADCEVAYRSAVTEQPSLGEAWWSLANLKTFRFRDDDLGVMAAALERDDLGDDDRFHLHFTLGKAFEDRGEWAVSFQHYARGNAIRRAQVRWDADTNTAHVEACERLFTPAFLAARAGSGCAAEDPIFVVGLPRSGSTLIEQILSSHSQVEGTMELPDITAIARRLGEGQDGGPGTRYLGRLATLDADMLRSLGEEYLERTRIQRKSGRPRFIDKMPNNFAFAGLIHLILPNAVIIDARRAAMATCFSAWKQHFARGQTFTYDLGELGRYYADYVRLMAHFDRVLPGRVLRVDYEDIVADLDTQVRRILAHCGLAFEPACLDFHANDRPVRTASSEQVRQPIYRDALDLWRHYDPWLGDLKATLGPLRAETTDA